MTEFVKIRKQDKSIVVSKETEDDESVILSKIDCPTILPISPVEGITLGLELLQETTHLFIRPSLMTEINYVSLEESSYRYDIIDINKGRIYYAWESESDGFGPNRTYTIKVLDFGGRPVLRVTKHQSTLACFLKWFNCCGSAGCFVTVNTPDGEKLGELKQKYNCCTPKFLVQNEFERQIMTILGPDGGDCCYNCNMMMDVEFPILSKDGEQIGRIDKGSTNPMENIDTFGCRFPQYLTVEQKATLLGCVFAINFLFFEREKKEDVVEIYEEKEREKRIIHRQEDYKRDLELFGLTKPNEENEGAPAPTEEAPADADETSVADETKVQAHYQHQRRTSIIVNLN